VHCWVLPWRFSFSRAGPGDLHLTGLQRMMDQGQGWKPSTPESWFPYNVESECHRSSQRSSLLTLQMGKLRPGACEDPNRCRQSPLVKSRAAAAGSQAPRQWVQMGGQGGGGRALGESFSPDCPEEPADKSRHPPPCPHLGLKEPEARGDGALFFIVIFQIRIISSRKAEG
jgi:hypothetical protein